MSTSKLELLLSAIRPNPTEIISLGKRSREKSRPRNDFGGVLTGNTLILFSRNESDETEAKERAFLRFPISVLMKKGPLSIAVENIYVVLLDEVQLMGQLFFKWNIFLTRRRQRKEKYELKTESVSTKNNENIFARGNRKKSIIQKE